MSLPLEPPPSIVNIFNWQWIKWLNNLYEFVKTGDYAEETWTVTLSDSSANDSATTVTGYYTKIGRLVVCHIPNFNDISTVGLTAGDQVRISLPLTSNATAGNASGTLIFDTINLSTGYNQINCFTGNNQMYCRLNQSGDNVTDELVIVSQLTSGTTDIIRLSISYFI
jgi:hypothetical protein